MTAQDRMTFQPEAHDIGKLIHLEGTELGAIIKANNHVFLAPDGNPIDFATHRLTPPSDENLTWLTALLHHPPRPGEYRLEAEECEDLSKPSRLSFETRSSIFLMMIADHMAAATSRTIAGKIKEGIKPSVDKKVDQGRTDHPRELVKLWNRSRKVSHSAGVNTIPLLQSRLLDYLRFDAEKEPFLKRFEPDLKSLPEDKFPLMNLTSLYTHCELVGKIYRLLDKHVERLPAKCEMSLMGVSAKTVHEAEQKWSLTLVRSEIGSPHQPVRVGDLNVTRVRNEILNELSRNSEAGDHILLRTADTLWLLFPGIDKEQTTSRLSNYFQPLCELGFYSENLLFSSPIYKIQNIDPTALLKGKTAELRRAEDNLRRAVTGNLDSKTVGNARALYIAVSKKLSPILETIFGTTYNASVAAEMGKQIEPPLCEICQMRPGKEIVNFEESRQVTDYLCDSCLSLRRSGERFRKLARWGEEKKHVAWIKVTLDKWIMEEVIRELYFRHAEETFGASPDAIEKISENFRNLGLLSDFVKDYFAFVKRFASEVFEKFGGDQDHSESGYSNVELLDEQYLEFFVLRIEDGETIARIMDRFIHSLRSSEHGFPDCLYKSPIKLRVSVSRSKYPFYEHWLFLKEDRGFIKIQMPSKVSLELSLDEYDRLAECGLEKGIARSPLHRLVSIEARTRSPLLVRAELAPEARDPRVQREFKEQLLRLDATGALPLSKVLSYAKLLEL